MAEIAGLTLGNASLAIQLATSLRKGFAFVESSSSADDNGKAFAVRLAIEYRRFVTWSDLSGLSSLTNPETHASADIAATRPDKGTAQEFELFIRYTEPVITRILEEMNTALTGLWSSDNKYSTFLDSGSDKPDTMSAADGWLTGPDIPDIADPDVDLVFPAQKTELHTERILNRLLRPHDANSKSGRWIIRDSKACARQIERIRDLNNFLEESLGHIARQKQIQAEKRFEATLVRAVHGISLLNVIPHPQTRNVPAGDEASTLSGITAAERPARHQFLLQAERFKLHVLDQGRHPPKNVQLDEALVANMTKTEWLETESREMAILPSPDGRRVWVEWTNYNEVNVADPGFIPFFDMDPKLVWKMDHLVSLLQIKEKPGVLRVPPCIGYFINEDDKRLAIVYEAPMTASTRTPRSLLSYLGNVEVSLSHRMRCAKDLAEWLFYLHSVRWSHKGIQSANILFFSTENAPTLQNPYMTGYSCVRYANKDSTTRPLNLPHAYYVHPDYLKPRYQEEVGKSSYRKIFDIYSLGIVLLELAYWKPIETILHEAMARSARAQGELAWQHDISHGVLIPEVEGRKLISGQHIILDRLRTLAGDEYYEVVRACLQGMTAFGLQDAASDRDTDVSIDLLDAYGVIVVQGLQNLVSGPNDQRSSLEISTDPVEMVSKPRSGPSDQRSSLENLTDPAEMVSKLLDAEKVTQMVLAAFTQAKTLNTKKAKEWRADAIDSEIRFRGWATGFTQYKDRGPGEIHIRLVSLLRELLDTLNEVLSILSGEREGFEDVETSRSEIGELMLIVEDVITSLVRTTMLIRSYMAGG